MKPEPQKPIAGIVTCLIAAASFVAGLIALAVRLHTVQVELSADYSLAKVWQSERRLRTAGVRGNIYARGGELLAGNRPVVSVVLNAVSFERRNLSQTAREIKAAIDCAGGVIGRPSPIGEDTILRHLRNWPSRPLKVWDELTSEELARFSENEGSLPGFEVVQSLERVYPLGATAAHLVGYVRVGQSTPSDSGDAVFLDSEPEMIGCKGLEAYYDSYLRGIPGERDVVVDARGFVRGEQLVAESRRGLDLQTTVDVGIQRAVEKALSGCRGACVVMSPDDGAVLAMVSQPAFDPNEFVPRIGRARYKELMDDPQHPLLNRTVGSAYAPGSTFKPITALGAMRSGWPWNYPYECIGFCKVGAMRIRCTSTWGHGNTDLLRALRDSCNPYFCDLSLQVGSNVVIAAARDFGLGSPTGIDFGLDHAGVVPDDAWKRSRYNERWFVGDLPQMSIGQGMLLTTPLQMARVFAAIGSGRLVRPRLMQSAPVVSRPLPFSEGDLEMVRRGLRMVVESGTGVKAGADVPVPVAGKTGTAEIGRGETRRKNTWFVGYAPAEHPRVAIAMVVENGESGGSTAAPRVNSVLRAVDWEALP